MFDLNLQLFADGGVGDGSAVAGSDTGVAQNAQSLPGDNGNVSQSSPDDRSKAYGQFKTNFKAEFDAEVQGIVKDRLKKSNAKVSDLSGKLKAQSGILSALADRYKVDVNDLGAIENALMNDDKSLEDEAYERNMTVDQLKAVKILERENRTLKAAEEERRMQAVFARWDAEAEQLRQIYPNFDLETELEDEDFRKLMNAGVPIKTAYEVSHKDEIIAGAMQYTARTVADKVSNSVRANKARPIENGVSSNTAVSMRPNISAMTPEQMQKYIERAAAGQEIDFVTKY